MAAPRPSDLKRLRIRSWRRGTREMDLILGGFADAALAALSPGDAERYEALLAENDHDLYHWIAGNGGVPERYRAIIARIRRHHRLS